MAPGATSAPGPFWPLGRDWYGPRRHMSHRAPGAGWNGRTGTGPRALGPVDRAQGPGPVDRDQWTGTSGPGPMGDQWTGPMGGPVDGPRARVQWTRAQGPGPVDQGPWGDQCTGPMGGPVDEPRSREQWTGPMRGPVDRAHGGTSGRAQGPRALGPNRSQGPHGAPMVPMGAIGPLGPQGPAISRRNPPRKLDFCGKHKLRC